MYSCGKCQVIYKFSYKFETDGESPVIFNYVLYNTGITLHASGGRISFKTEYTDERMSWIMYAILVPVNVHEAESSTEGRESLSYERCTVSIRNIYIKFFWTSNGTKIMNYGFSLINYRFWLLSQLLES